MFSTHKSAESGNKMRRAISMPTTREARLTGHVTSCDMTSTNKFESSEVAKFMQCSHISLCVCMYSFTTYMVSLFNQ